MIAVRSNERAAAALGISVVGVKLYAFAVGAGIAALGGILLAFRQTNVQFSRFNVFGSILLVQYAVIGGLGWISGVVLGASAAPGAIVEQITSDLFPNLDNVAAWLAIFSAIGVIQLLRRAPDGVASLWAPIGTRLRCLVAAATRRRRRSPVAAPSSTSPLTGRELEVRGVSVRFGGVVAVDDVSFTVSPGEVVGLIGPNGAGQDDAARRRHRLHAPAVRARCCSTASTCRRGVPSGGPGPASRARGRASSCSTS